MTLYIQCMALESHHHSHHIVLCAEFCSVLAFRQHHDMPHYFGCSDLYFICRLRPLTFDLHPCEKEVEECQWMSVHELATSEEVCVAFAPPPSAISPPPLPPPRAPF